MQNIKSPGLTLSNMFLEGKYLFCVYE